MKYSGASTRKGLAILTFVAFVVGATPGFSQSVLPNILSENGLGALRVGMKFEEAKKLFAERLVKNEDQDPTGQCYFGIPNENMGMHLMFIHDKLVRIDVSEKNKSNIRTTSGLHIKSSLHDVEETYHGRLSKLPSSGEGYTLLVRADGEKGRGFGFFVENGRVTWIYAGDISAIKRPEDCL